MKCAYAARVGKLSTCEASSLRTIARSCFIHRADAIELDRALVAQENRPIQLIVPDGTWRQARKLHSRHPELKCVPRVKISAPNHSSFQLRAQSRPEGMATLQAIACGLGVIEGEWVQLQLMKLYEVKIKRILIGRGVLRPEWKAGIDSVAK